MLWWVSATDHMIRKKKQPRPSSGNRNEREVHRSFGACSKRARANGFKLKV